MVPNSQFRQDRPWPPGASVITDTPCWRIQWRDIRSPDIQPPLKIDEKATTFPILLILFFFVVISLWSIKYWSGLGLGTLQSWWGLDAILTTTLVQINLIDWLMEKKQAFRSVSEEKFEVVQMEKDQWRNDGKNLQDQLQHQYQQEFKRAWKPSEVINLPVWGGFVAKQSGYQWVW